MRQRPSEPPACFPHRTNLHRVPTIYHPTEVRATGPGKASPGSKRLVAVRQERPRETPHESAPHIIADQDDGTCPAESQSHLGPPAARRRASRPNLLEGTRGDSEVTFAQRNARTARFPTLGCVNLNLLGAVHAREMRDSRTGEGQIGLRAGGQSTPLQYGKL